MHINRVGIILASIVSAVGLASLVIDFELASDAYDIVYIRSEKDLEKIRNNPNGHYIFDVDGQIVIGEKWVPIGTDERPFTGYIEGNYETIFFSKGYDEKYVEQSNFEVNLGFVGVNKGTIKHLTITAASFLNENDISEVHALNFGNVVGKNEGYVTGCYSTISGIKLGTKFVESSVGGVVGLNKKQVQGCSFNTHFTFESLFLSYAGSLVGYNNGGTIKYCWFNYNSYFSSSNFNSAFGSCIGYCDGGLIENISLSTNNNSSHQMPYERAICKFEEDSPMSIGGILGKIYCIEPVKIDRVVVDLVFEHYSKPTFFGFVCGDADGESKLTLSNCVVSGRIIDNNYPYSKSLGINSDSVELDKVYKNLYFYDVNEYSSYNDYTFFNKAEYSQLNLKMLNFDEAVWKKGKFSFYLIYHEKY